MAFFNSAVTVLQTLVIALGAGLGKVPGHEAAHGWRRCCPHRHHPCTSALRTVRLITKQGGNRLWTAYSNRSQTG